MVKGARYTYFGAAVLFLLGVLTQVFLAGMVVVAIRMGWDAHIGLGHTLAGPLLFMLVSMYLGKLPGRMKRLTWLLFLVYVLQADVIIFLRFQAPVISALHPVLALIDFALGWTLAQKAWGLLRQPTADSLPQPDLSIPVNR